MNREIKFRAWDTHYKMMVYDVSVYHNADGIGIPYVGDGPYTSEMIDESSYLAEGENDWLYILSNFELMQYTGLKDKNDKEIYEGDICRGPNGKHWVIQWIGHSWCMTNEIIPSDRMKFAGEETYTIDGWLDLPPRKQALQVIGNIYENPELLNR